MNSIPKNSAQISSNSLTKDKNSAKLQNSISVEIENDVNKPSNLKKYESPSKTTMEANKLNKEGTKGIHSIEGILNILI